MNKDKKQLVTLEPQLEAMAKLWNPIKRLEMAKMFHSWARQLEVSVFIMVRDADDPKPSFSAKRARLRHVLKYRQGSRN